MRQRDGYLGWAHGPYLADADNSAPAATHFVAEPALSLYAAPGDPTPVARLPIGTAVAVVAARGDWLRVQLSGTLIPSGWARGGGDGLRPVSSLPLPPDKAREQIVADARRLTGVYYLWGGGTAWGIDCSGLSQLCHRLAGYAIPRDASLQYPAGRAVDPNSIRPGDLLFFHGETNKDRITHVGISLGGWRIIHSSRSRNGVYEDDLDAPHNRRFRDRVVGARSFLD